MVCAGVGGSVCSDEVEGGDGEEKGETLCSVEIEVWRAWSRRVVEIWFGFGGRGRGRGGVDIVRSELG